MNSIAIAGTLLERFHVLAQETQRPEAEIINEALSSYLDTEDQYIVTLRQRITAADHNEFASEEEVEQFFATPAFNSQSR